MKRAIENIGLDLSSQTVLTEAATGPFMCTPILAGMAGAKKVFAFTQNSHWGRATDIINSSKELAHLCGCKNIVFRSNANPLEIAHEVEIITNLGFVRPITKALIEKLPKHAAIALMWEPWEFRDSDIDIAACEYCDIPVIATNERHENVATFKYVGILSLKLLLEAGLEVLGLNVVIIGSDPFGKACFEALKHNGVHVTCYDPIKQWPPVDYKYKENISKADAIVVVEHKHKGEIIGSNEGIQIETKKLENYPIIIHICGTVDVQYLSQKRILKYPSNNVPFGYMTVTTAYVGPKPVIDLHCAGLHVASITSRTRKKGKPLNEAIHEAVISGYGLPLHFFHLR